MLKDEKEKARKRMNLKGEYRQWWAGREGNSLALTARFGYRPPSYAKVGGGPTGCIGPREAWRFWNRFSFAFAYDSLHRERSEAVSSRLSGRRYMRRVSFIAAMAVFLTSFTGCDSKEVDPAAELLKFKKETLQILRTVSDKNSAVAATPKIKAIFDKAERLCPSLIKSGDTNYSPPVEREAEYHQLWHDITAELRRIEAIPGNEEPMRESMFFATWISAFGVKP